MKSTTEIEKPSVQDGTQKDVNDNDANSLKAIHSLVSIVSASFFIPFIQTKSINDLYGFTVLKDDLRTMIANHGWGFFKAIECLVL
jgi:hypothetical protein